MNTIIRRTMQSECLCSSANICQKTKRRESNLMIISPEKSRTHVVNSNAYLFACFSLLLYWRNWPCRNCKLFPSYRSDLAGCWWRFRFQEIITMNYVYCEIIINKGNQIHLPIQVTYICYQIILCTRVKNLCELHTRCCCYSAKKTVYRPWWKVG